MVGWIFLLTNLRFIESQVLSHMIPYTAFIKLLILCTFNHQCNKQASKKQTAVSSSSWTLSLTIEIVFYQRTQSHALSWGTFHLLCGTNCALSKLLAMNPDKGNFRSHRE
jgi:hypothetical protein